MDGQQPACQSLFNIVVLGHRFGVRLNFGHSEFFGYTAANVRKIPFVR
jgi:hypothetical protein